MNDRTRVRPRERQVAEVDIQVEHRSRGQLTSERNRTEHPRAEAPANCARMRVGGSATINMGDYNSVRCSVEIEWPFEPTEEAMNATYEWVSGEVDRLLQIEIDASTGTSNTETPF